VQIKIIFFSLKFQENYSHHHHQFAKVLRMGHWT